jgi:hypothetical protein
MFAHQPTLRRWLIASASEPPRVRRALLVRAAQELRASALHREAADALEDLTDARLLQAVTKALFLQSGLELPAPVKRTGRIARVRLAELAERFHVLDTLQAP